MLLGVAQIFIGQTAQAFLVASVLHHGGDHVGASNYRTYRIPKIVLLDVLRHQITKHHLLEAAAYLPL
jgi:hypothetical protein